MNLSVTLEGNPEERPARLAQGNGYALYVPEGFEPLAFASLNSLVNQK
ncbi:hypothetical protein [Paenibacillus caui]|nr:hypothetical protein [Paenibacillus caui]